jgi:phosphoserine phosphatase
MTPPIRHLLVLDVDSTLTTTEGIDILADLAGSGPQVAQITDRAMRGELDFAESLRARVATLAGLSPAQMAQANARVALTPGAAQLVDTLHAAGWAVGAVSGGFDFMVRPLARALGLDHFQANTLEAADDGSLTGRLSGPVIDARAKAEALAEWSALYDLEPAAVAAMGDGANDLLMLKAAGLALAFNAKPAVAAAADYVISEDLSNALPILLRELP